MPQKNITVVIPTFNEEAYIKNCLDAVFAQTVLPDEVIVVDNNSTDKTLAIVSKYRNVKVMKEPRQGQLYARITGFNAVKTGWIASLDADSIIDKTWIEQMMQHASKKHQAFSSYIYIKEASFNRLSTALTNFYYFSLNRAISGHFPLWGANFVISKRVWDTVKSDLRLRTELWEDLEIGLLAEKSGHKTSLLKVQNAQISMRAGSIPVRDVYRRLIGWPKTYWRYKKLAAVTSFFLVFVVLGIGFVLKIPIFAHYHAKKYSGWS